MNILKPLIIIAIMSGFWLAPIRYVRGQQPEYPLALSIECTNESIRVPGELFVSVSITNGGQSTVSVYRGVCVFPDYRAWLEDTQGQVMPLGKKSLSNSGPEVFSAHLFYEIAPHTSVGGTLTVPLNSGLQPGIYRLKLSRSCLILKPNEGGRIASQFRKEVVSNALKVHLQNK